MQTATLWLYLHMTFPSLYVVGRVGRGGRREGNVKERGRKRGRGREVSSLIVHWTIRPPILSDQDSVHKTLWVCAQPLQSCPTVCDPMDCSPPGSSVHGILQARILEWVTMSSSRGSSLLRDRTCICAFHIAGGFFTTEPSGKPYKISFNLNYYLLKALFSKIITWGLGLQPMNLREQDTIQSMLLLFSH